jgi:hypothetical protein
MSGPGSSKDDSLRSRTPSNSLTDHLLSMRYLPAHPRVSTVRSLLPRRTQQEEHEFLASILSEAMSIIDNDFDNEGGDDDSADDDGNGSGSSSTNSTNYGDRKQ